MNESGNLKKEENEVYRKKKIARIYIPTYVSLCARVGVQCYFICICVYTCLAYVSICIIILYNVLNIPGVYMDVL